jgi:cytochrome d ubiquinol oxidase subunit II
MTTAWFVLLALMIAVYAVLDGFDLGVGALHRLLARDDAERGEAVEAIGPVWNGNEVWLIAAGGVLFLAFPKAYAAAFSGMYLGFIIVLWLLVGRGLGLELRGHLDSPLWRSACDTVFWLSSAGLVLLLGLALGNVVRGVPLGPDGSFRLALFGLLNWYAVLVGILALAVVAAHGAGFLATTTTGSLAQRARRWAPRLWAGALVLLVGVGAATHSAREGMLTSFGDHPWRLVFPALAVAALAAQRVWQRRDAWRRAFLASSAAIAGLLATTAAGLYPQLLPARDDGPYGLSVDNAASGHYALTVALVWWSIAIALTTAYFIVAYRFLAVATRPATSQDGGGGQSAEHG